MMSETLLYPDRSILLPPPLETYEQSLGLLDMATGDANGLGNTYSEDIVKMWQSINLYYSDTLPGRIHSALIEGPGSRLFSEAVRTLDCVDDQNRTAFEELIPDSFAPEDNNSTDRWLDPALASAIERVKSTDQDEARSEVSHHIERVISDDRSPDPAKKKATWKLKFALPEDVPELIYKVLRDPGIYEKAKRTAAWMIEFAPENQIADLIERTIEDSNLDIVTRSRATMFTAYVPDHDISSSLHQKARQLGLLKPLSFRSPLHDAVDDHEVVDFEKTDSRTYILPSKYEASVREIGAGAFKQWTKAYQLKQEWREAGFEHYVPVEPIVNFEPVDDFNVLVTTHNLRGKSMVESLTGYDLDVQRKLLAMKNIHGQVMRAAGIEHTHDNYGNYVLTPTRRTSDEAPDPSQVPGLFCIDFDLAKKL